MTNTIKYQTDINRELSIIKDRVRDLIGDAHWGEDGAYKEEKLKAVIASRLPANLSVGTGFILSQTSPTEKHISKQIDIIVYNNQIPTIFREGDFVIVTQNAVKGVIEVKSSIKSSRTDKNGLFKVLDKFQYLSNFPMLTDTGEDRIFRGVIAFDYPGKIGSNVIDDSLRMSNGLVNHISLGGHIFIRHWINDSFLMPPINAECHENFYNIYQLTDLSHAYFISNLIHMSTSEDLTDQYFISFPIEGTKEIRRHRTICQIVD